jgi:drug/metabolite transporter (DMT)-like permease
VALAVAASLWGLTVPLSKLGMDWLGAAWLAVARFAIAAPLLGVLARRNLRAAITPGVVAAGAGGYGIVILLQNAGIEHTSVTHASLIVGAVPVLVAIIAAVLGRGAATALTWGGSLIALAGVGLVAGGGGAGTSLTGDLLVLASVTGSAAFIVAQPRLLEGRDAGAVTAVQLGAGGIAALPFAIVFEGAPPAPTTATPILALVALALAGTALAFWLFAWAQSRVPAEVAGAFVNLEPLVGAATGAVAFHDAVGAPQLLGGAAILAGIALGALPSRRAAGDRRRAGDRVAAGDRRAPDQSPNGRRDFAAERPAPSPGDRPAVAEEASGRAFVREGRRPHDSGRAVTHRPSSRTAHVRRHPARADGVHEHAVATQCVGEHQREGVERGLGE